MSSAAMALTASSTAGKALVFTKDEPLVLSSGQSLGPVTVAYQTYGALNAAGDNAVLICHALTGSAHVSDYGFSAPSSLGAGWWNELVAGGKVLDPEGFFIVSTNILGSCYGSTGPTEVNPDTGAAYGPNFPEIDVRDMVRVQQALLQQLGIERLHCVIGGSLGGMQALEWCALYPEMVGSAVVMASSAAHSAWAIAFNETARQAIRNDPAWENGFYRRQPLRGLGLARMMAMISYRSQVSYQARFGRVPMGANDPRPAGLFGENPPTYQIQNYLRYQGEKLVERFDANSYLTITRAMDRHDLGRGRGSVEAVLGQFPMPVLCVGISSDVLYPPEEQRRIAAAIPQAQYAEIQSVDGHDAFLIEAGQLDAMIRKFFEGAAR